MEGATKITLEAWQWYLLITGGGAAILFLATHFLRFVLEIVLQRKVGSSASSGATVAAHAVKDAQDCKACRAEITADRDFAVATIRKEIQAGFARTDDRYYDLMKDLLKAAREE